MDEVQYSLFLFLPSQAFEDKVGRFRFGNGNHFYFFGVGECDSFGEGSFADFAFELGEVIGANNAIDLFFDLAIDPVLEALETNDLAGAPALAGIDQRVFFGSLIHQAYFALPLVRFSDLVVLSVELKLIVLMQSRGILAVFDLQYQEFYPTQPDDIPR